MRTTALIASLTLLALPACGTVAKGGVKTVGLAGKGVITVAEVPLEDLNLKRDKIPKELKRIDRVYPEVAPESCFMVDFELRELDSVLGPDEDELAGMDDDRAGLMSRARAGAGSATKNGVRDLAADQIPFRGVVRTVSGAKRSERKHREAFERGEARRNYLKGLGDAMGCDDARVQRELYEDEEKKKFLGLF